MQLTLEGSIVVMLNWWYNNLWPIKDFQIRVLAFVHQFHSLAGYGGIVKETRAELLDKVKEVVN